MGPVERFDRGVLPGLRTIALGGVALGVVGRAVTKRDGEPFALGEVRWMEGDWLFSGASADVDVLRVRDGVVSFAFGGVVVDVELPLFAIAIGRDLGVRGAPEAEAAAGVEE